MGFRSNFITQDIGIEMPLWFWQKYPQHLFRRNNDTGKYFFPMVQTWESKFYSTLQDTEIFLDIQKVLAEQKPLYEGHQPSLVLVLLHECGGLTRIKITPASISGREPTEWKDVDHVEHDYCYGCSDA